MSTLSGALARAVGKLPTPISSPSISLQSVVHFSTPRIVRGPQLMYWKIAQRVYGSLLNERNNKIHLERDGFFFPHWTHGAALCLSIVTPLKKGWKGFQRCVQQSVLAALPKWFCFHNGAHFSTFTLQYSSCTLQTETRSLMQMIRWEKLNI